ncbi:MAG: hypothetical protein U0746_21790 [Gemmataceae bacterium]
MSVRVPHCVLARLVKKDGTHPGYDFFGVCYMRTVPSDTEFPRVVSDLHLFLRFFVENAGPTAIRFRVWWCPQGRDRRLLTDLRPQGPLGQIDFPASGHDYLDIAFRLPPVQLEGLGVHAIEAYCRPGRPRRGLPWQRKRGWNLVAVEYFAVERQS